MVATCPMCQRKARVNSKGILLAHSVPRWAYRDGRGCRGAGKVAVEYRKRPYTGRTYGVRYPEFVESERAVEAARNP